MAAAPSALSGPSAVNFASALHSSAQSVQSVVLLLSGAPSACFQGGCLSFAPLRLCVSLLSGSGSVGLLYRSLRCASDRCSICGIWAICGQLRFRTSFIHAIRAIRGSASARRSIHFLRLKLVQISRAMLKKCAIMSPYTFNAPSLRQLRNRSFDGHGSAFAFQAPW